MRIKIDDEIYEVDKVQDRYKPYSIKCGRMEFILFEDATEAGAAVSDYYKNLRKYDKCEFMCLIGKERLLQWAVGESDNFGISSFEEFLKRVATVPEEHWACYDGNERDVQRVGRLVEELGFTPTVAYRSN